MNPLDIIKKLFDEGQCVEDQLNPLYAQTNYKLPILDDDFYTIAEKISHIEGFEDIAECLLTEEKPQKIASESFLSLWILILESLPKLLPQFKIGFCAPLQQVFLKHLLNVQQNKYSSPIWITSQIKNLTIGQSFHFLLEQKKITGNSLENVVVYQRNADRSFDIKLYFAKEGNWLVQGGHYTLGHENLLPLRYYAHVPEEDLLGPQVDQEAIHVRLILRALDDFHQSEKALLAVFAPLHPYLTHFETHKIHVEHAHLLKGMHAYIFACLSEALADESLMAYKACLCVLRLTLSIAIMKSFDHQKAESLYAKFGLLSQASCTTARHLEKQQNNPFFKTIFEAAIGTLGQLKEKAEKLQRAAIDEDQRLIDRQFAYPQEKLTKLVLQKSKLFLDQELPIKEIQKRKIPDNDFLILERPPIDPKAFPDWLRLCEERVVEIEKRYADMAIPSLMTVISLLEIPSENSIWKKMDEKECLHCLQTLNCFSYLLARIAFQQHLRFSLEIQNGGAKLLIIAYALAESLDSAHVLERFKPALKEYKKLTASPYFQMGSFLAWKQREAILSYLQEKDTKNSAWSFDRKERVLFDKTPDGFFAEAILNALPEINQKIEDHLRKVQQRKKTEEKKTILPGQFFLAELFQIKIQDYIEGVLDFNNKHLMSLSMLAQTAMHVHLLADKRAKHQTGYENTVFLEDGFNFDLEYAKNFRRPFDFHLENTRDPMIITPIQRNFLTKEKRRCNQNETLRQFAVNEENLNILFVCEESCAESDIESIQLISQFKSLLVHFCDLSTKTLFEKYLFRIKLEKGREYFALEKEIKLYPHVFNNVIRDFLQALKCFRKNLGHGEISPQGLYGISFSIQLYHLAKHLDCLPLLETLEVFFKEEEKNLFHSLERGKPHHNGELLILLLRIIEISPQEKIDWEAYFKWGCKLQEQLEQKIVILDPCFQLWWNEMRWRMAQKYPDIREANQFEEKKFDVLSMSRGKGKWQQIPQEILKHQEFIKLFSNRINFWQLEGQLATFSDPLTGKYRLLSQESFPKNLQRLIDNVWHHYLPMEKAASTLLIPQAISQESIWWVSPGTRLNAKGYYKKDPNKLWLELGENGSILFKDGPARQMRLELIEDHESALTVLEKNSGVFGQHYHAYHPRFVYGQLMEFRDLLVFPNLRMPHGSELVFERHGHDFLEQKNLKRKLVSCLYAPSSYYADGHHTKYKSTPIRLHGILLSKINPETLGQNDEKILLLPLCRHVSDPHSNLVHALSPDVHIDTPSLLNSIEVIEIKTGAIGLYPESSLEMLFSAYLYLIGKDYSRALKSLKGLRQNHHLTDVERRVIKWLIESRQDASDHSAIASAVKLLAYKILIQQGVAFTGKIDPKELPVETLEAVYLNYLNHISSVPCSYCLDLEMEKWILEKGFKFFPPLKEREHYWHWRANEIDTGHRHLEFFQLPKPSRQLLFERWKNGMREMDPIKIEFSNSLMEGILHPVDQPIDPGREYPEGALGSHYMKLATNNIPTQEKWELLYALETSTIPESLKLVLKTAFNKNVNCLPLPKLEKKSRLENWEITHAWFQQLIEPFPLQPYIKNIHKTIEIPINIDQMGKENLEGNKIFAEKIFKTYQEKKLTSYELLRALQVSFTKISKEKPFIAVECPFNEDEIEEPTFKSEVKAYRIEWENGIELQKQSKVYMVPEINQLEELHRILEIYPNEIHLDSLKKNLMRILNRRPIGISPEAILLEIREKKQEMDLEDAFKTIFLSDKNRKLAYLKMYNPFFLEEDLKVLNRCLQEYLERCITDKILIQIKNKIVPILKIAKADKAWSENPAVQEIWQEVGELLNPFDQYPEDQQIHLETLLFEHLCGFRIREEQAQTLHTLVEKILNANPQNQSFAAIFQIIMGGGKTSVILALLAKFAAKQGKVPIFLAYHSQYPSLKANLVNTQYKRVNQDVIDLDFDRSDLSSMQILKYIYKQLKKAEKDGHLLLTKTNFIIMLRLEFRSQLDGIKDPQNLDPLNLERGRQLAKILDFMASKCLFLGDEIDCSLNLLEEMTFPVGPSLVISQESLALIKEIYVILSTHPNISELLKLDQDDQSLVAKKKLNSNIFPWLVDALIEEYAPLSNLILPARYKEMRDSLKDYILGKIDSQLKEGIDCLDDKVFFETLKLGEEQKKIAERHLAFLRHLKNLKLQISEHSKASLHAVALVKEMCTEILPFVLGKGNNRNYGFTETGKIIPFLGVDEPNRTEFGNIYVTTSCYFQAALRTGVNANRFLLYRDQMREASFHYAEIYHHLPEESSEAKHFKAMTGLDLHQELNPNELDQVLSEMNQNARRCLDFYGEFSSAYLKYHSRLLTGSPMILATTGNQFVGCAGILWNKDTFARKLAQNCIPKKGVEGRILVKWSQDLAAKKCFFSLIDKAEPHIILQAVLDKRQEEGPKRLRALIDAGGMLKNYTNEKVAREILKFTPLQEEIDAVIFLNKITHSFYLLKREGELVPLLTTSRTEIEKKGVTVDRVFIYFDELRATGSDIPFKSNGIAAKTFRPGDTIMRTDSQANFRPRNFLYAQTVDTIIHKESLEEFINYNEKIPEECLNFKNFTLTAIRNQKELKKKLLVRSALEQIKEIYCSAISKFFQMILKNDEIDFEKMNLLKHTEELFYQTFKDDPISLFLDLQTEMSAYQFVQSYAEKTQNRFEGYCAQFFEQAELHRIKIEIQEVIDWAKVTLTWKISSTFNSSLELQIHVERQQEKQLETNLETQNEIQKELQKYAVRIDAPAALIISWKKVKDQPRSFFDYEFPSILSFRKLLKRVIYDHPYFQIFPKDLYLTENLARSHEVDLPVFHKGHKKIYHLLLVKEKEQFRSLFIDLKEASFWREQIQKYPIGDCWLCDLEGYSLNEGNTIPEEANPILKRTLWWGHFFNGNMNYLRTQPNLVQTEFKQENYELKYRFLALKSANDPIQGKILSIDPILSRNPLEAPVFQFNNREEEENWLSKEIEILDEHELNKLPFHFSRFMSEKQVPLLKRQGYFTYLLPEKFAFIRPEQVKYIPNYRLRYLCQQEQIAQLPPEKIYWLKGKALEFVPEEYMDRINPEELNQLPPILQKKYQKLQIKKFGLKEFSKTVRPAMASVILPKCVEFIPDECLPFLVTEQQLAQVSQERYSFLKAHQFHLLPKENWPLLKIDDYKKYATEKSIPEEAKELIRQMNPDWANQVDPRLAKFYQESQVRQISNPKFIEYLDIDQLSWLEITLSGHINLEQISKLSASHGHLIRSFEEPEVIQRLSLDGLKELTEGQVQIIKDHKTLLKLDAQFYPYLLAKQIHLLQPKESKDQEIIKHLNKGQLKKLDRNYLLASLPYLNEEALKSLEASLFAEAKGLPLEVCKKLSSLQMQSYLQGMKSRQKNVTRILKELTVSQWAGMDRLFLETFFSRQNKGAIKCIPSKHVRFLPKTALLKWYDADLKKNKIKDIVSGICSFIFYPFVLISALLLIILGHQKRHMNVNIFRGMALSPLRFIARESYYRIISG